MELITDIKQAYSWNSISHPFRSTKEGVKFTAKDIGKCGGLAAFAGLLTFPFFPFTAFATYYLSKYYILKNREVAPIDLSSEEEEGGDVDSAKKADKIARKSVSEEADNSSVSKKADNTKQKTEDASSEDESELTETSSSDEETAPETTIQDLPNEIMHQIFSHLKDNPKNFLPVRGVNKLWKELSHDFFTPLVDPSIIASNLLESVEEPHYKMSVLGEPIEKSKKTIYRFFDSQLFIMHVMDVEEGAEQTSLFVSVQDLDTGEETERYTYQSEKYHNNKIPPFISITEDHVTISYLFKDPIVIFRGQDRIVSVNNITFDAYLISSNQYIFWIDLKTDIIKKFDHDLNEISPQILEGKEMENWALRRARIQAVNSTLVFVFYTTSKMERQTGFCVYDSNTGKLESYPNHRCIQIRKIEGISYLLMGQHLDKTYVLKVINLNTNEKYKLEIKKPQDLQVDWNNSSTFPLILERTGSKCSLYSWNWQSNSKKLVANFKRKMPYNNIGDLWMIKEALVIAGYRKERPFKKTLEVYKKGKEKKFHKVGSIVSHEKDGEHFSPIKFSKKENFLYQNGKFFWKKCLEESNEPSQIISLDFTEPLSDAKA